MFKQYIRTNIAEMRPVTAEEATGYIEAEISISDTDKQNGSPKIGDMVARNPKNFEDRWLVSEKYFHDNFKEMM